MQSRTFSTMRFTRAAVAAAAVDPTEPGCNKTGAHNSADQPDCAATLRCPPARPERVGGLFIAFTQELSPCWIVRVHSTAGRKPVGRNCRVPVAVHISPVSRMSATAAAAATVWTCRGSQLGEGAAGPLKWLARPRALCSLPAPAQFPGFAVKSLIRHN